MANIDLLVKLAQSYHRRAVVAQQQQAAQYHNSVVQKMQSVADQGINVTNQLLTNPKNAHSPGLSALKERLPEVKNHLNGFRPQNVDDDWYRTLVTLIDGMTFYTNTGNAGTGYDPITRMGNPSPGSYVDYLQKLSRELRDQRITEFQ